MSAPVKAWFLYLVRCSDGTIYTGIARDVAARMAAHEAGRGARYTRGRGPLAVCAVRRCESQSEALRLEYGVKRLPRAQKEKLLTTRKLSAYCRRETIGTNHVQSTVPRAAVRSLAQHIV